VNTRDNVSMESSMGKPGWARLWFIWAVAWFSIEPFEPQRDKVSLRVRAKVRVKPGGGGRC